MLATIKSKAFVITNNLLVLVKQNDYASGGWDPIFLLYNPTPFNPHSSTISVHGNIG